MPLKEARSVSFHHPGVELRANRRSISHRCYFFEVAFVWELTKETIHLSLGCLQGGKGLSHVSPGPAARIRDACKRVPPRRGAPPGLSPPVSRLSPACLPPVTACLPPVSARLPSVSHLFPPVSCRSPPVSRKRTPPRRGAPPGVIEKEFQFKILWQ